MDFVGLISNTFYLGFDVKQLNRTREKGYPLPKIKRNLKGALLGTFSSYWALGWFIGTINLDEEICTKCDKCVHINHNHYGDLGIIQSFLNHIRNK